MSRLKVPAKQIADSLMKRRRKLLDEIESIPALKKEFHEKSEELKAAEQQADRGEIPYRRVNILQEEVSRLSSRINTINNEHSNKLLASCSDEELNAEHNSLRTLRAHKQTAVRSAQDIVDEIDEKIASFVSSNMTQEHGSALVLDHSEAWPRDVRETWARRFGTDGVTFTVEKRKNSQTPSKELIEFVNKKLAEQFSERDQTAAVLRQAEAELAEVQKQLDDNRQRRILSPV